MNIGQRIKEERRKKGFSQEYVANAIKTTKQAIYKYESGIVTNIPTDKISKMAALFGVTPAYLMGWDENNEQNTSAENKNVFISYKDVPEGRARIAARRFPLELQEPWNEDPCKAHIFSGKVLPQEQSFKIRNTRRNTLSVLNLCNSKTQKLCSKISKLDDSDLDKTAGFVEALLTADKYNNPQTDQSKEEQQ